jgi:hypothetical protein
VRILFFTHDTIDYASDPLYVGLSRVLGNDQVVEFPYREAFHHPEARLWCIAQRPGRQYSRQEILDLLRDRYFDLVCLASFRQDSLAECRWFYQQVPFPPMVFVDGEDGPELRHDVLKQYPIQVYFKRDYAWGLGNQLQDFWARTWTFRGDRELFDRTVPLPLSIVPETLPDCGNVKKECDVSYRGRASHPRRVKAMEILSGMDGITFAGGVYASPGDRKYKMKAGMLQRWRTKVFDDMPATQGDQEKKHTPGDYYREIASSKIAVALRGGGLTASLRYFEIVAMRSLLLSDAPETLIPNDFIPGRHAVYCRPDLKDLESLVRYYTKADAEREAMIQEAYSHLMKYHTCERRAEYFLGVCTRMI